MVTLKFALVSLTLIVLFEAYNARNLHGVSIKESFHVRPPAQVTVIQMVTRKEKLLLPQSSPLSSSYDYTTYGRVSRPPPPLNAALLKGQETYDRVNSPPPPPDGAPSKGPGTYGRVNSPPPPPDGAPSKGHETYGRVNSPPPPPDGAPSKGPETYDQVNSPPPPDGAPSKGPETYGRVNSPPPSPDGALSKGHETYGRVNSPLPPPPPPDGAPSQIQTFYREDKANSNDEGYDATIDELKGFLVTLSSKQDRSMGKTKYDQDDNEAQPSSDPSGSQVPGMYEQGNPGALATTKPTRPLLSDGGSACIESTGWRLSSYVTRVFKY